jgi:site-specific DNA recombinase
MVAPLKGILRCGHCNCRLGPTFGAKNGKRYPYYLCTKDSKRSLSICPVKRISATEIESLVIDQIGKLFVTPTFVNNVTISLGITGNEITKIFSSMQSFWQELYPAERNRLIELLVASVVVSENKVELEFRTEGMTQLIEEMKDVNAD